jgi:microcystin-dependent protein
MADFSTSAAGAVSARRSWLQRIRQALSPKEAPATPALVSMRPTGGQPYVGEIAIFAGNFPPAGWMFCYGQLLPISENDVLFQLIGTTYGGDGQETFGLPDLRGRVPMHMGQGAGLTNRTISERAGAEAVTLTTQQIPQHNHVPLASSAPGTTASPAGALPADNGAGSAQYTQDTDSLVKQPVQTLYPMGSSQPHSNMQPYLTVNYIISLFGVYPSPS